MVGVNGPLSVGGSPNIKHPRFEVWGACLEKVWRGLGHILMAIDKGPPNAPQMLHNGVRD